MDTRATFRGIVSEKGVLVLDEPLRWRGAIARLAGKRVDVTVERERKTRSNQQSRYFHGVVLRLISEWSGMDEDEIKDYLVGKFFPKQCVLPTGEEIPGRQSTKDLTTAQFEELCERSRAWAGQQGVYIPLPNEPMAVNL